MKKAFCLALALLFVSGCHTINYNNGTGGVQGRSFDEWHHIGIVNLVEFSQPVDLSDRCPSKGWSTAQTELSFVRGLVAGLTFGIYTPHGVEYACRR